MIGLFKKYKTEENEALETFLKHLQISIKLKITQAVIPNDNSLKFIIHHSLTSQSIIKKNVGNGSKALFGFS